MYRALQGNLGLGKAIEYFTSHSISVALPLNDTQKYDLVADFNGGLKKVSIKTSQYTKYEGSYTIQLRNTGGSSGKIKYRDFDNTSCDYIFVYLADEKIFLIPSNKIDAKNAINVGIKYTEFEVKIKSFKQFSEENPLED